MESTRRRLLQESNMESGSIVDEMKSYSREPVANDGIMFMVMFVLIQLHQVHSKLIKKLNYQLLIHHLM